MKVLRLDIKKIQYELDRIGQTQTWLAKQINFSPQRLNGILRNERPVFHAEKFGHIFGVDPRLFITLKEEVK